MDYTTSKEDYMELSNLFGFETFKREDTLGSQQVKQEENSQFVSILILW